MKKFCNTIILFLLFVSLCFAATELIVPPQRHHITKNIHFLVDLSGSMSNLQVQTALQQAMEIIEQPSDGFNVAITAFGEDFKRMEIVDENCKVGPNWIAMPSAEKSQEIRKWLESVSIGKSDTNLRQPLLTAIEEEVDELSVIIISDCEISFLEFTEDIKNTSIPIGVIGIFMSNSTKEKITAAVNEDEGGSWFVNLSLE